MTVKQTQWEARGQFNPGTDEWWEQRRGEHGWFTLTDADRADLNLVYRKRKRYAL